MIPTLEFGRTGHSSSRTLLGAAAFSQASQADTDAALEHALSMGVNHVDTAASYGDSELRIGHWIRRHGTAFFLATKTGERTAAAARDQFHRSLERLGVDHVDLLQLHNLVDPAEWETALGPGGALEAAVQARQEGLTRFIGITGHGLTVAAMHRRALDRFPFDSVLFPLSYILMQNTAYARDVESLLDVCRARGVAAQAIKAVVRAPWGDHPHTYTTWYEPLADPVELTRAVHWVLAQPGVFLNTAADLRILPLILEAASNFQSPPPEPEMRAQVLAQSMAPLFT